MSFDPVSDGDVASGATRRNQLIVRGSMLTEAVQEFPLFVQLRSPSVDLSAAHPDGADLRFYAADQITALPYEIEHISPAGADAWVRVPEIVSGADTILWVTYGDRSAPMGQRPEEVWAPEFVAVWHLADGHDSTANRLDGTFTGTASTTGLASLGRDLQLGWLEVAHAPALASIGATGQATWSAWARPIACPDGTTGLIDRRTELTSLDDFRFGPTASGATNGQVNLDPGQQNLAFGAGAFTFGAWHLFAMTFDGVALRASIDGVNVQTSLGSGTLHASANPVWLGAGCNGCAGMPNSDRMDGILDEARIASVVRSDAWLTAEYLNLTSGLVTVQPFE